MIDKLELRIPFKREFCIFSPDHSSAILPSFDKYILNDGLETRSTRSSDDGLNFAESYETHSYESLASSFSGVAFCVYSRGVGGFPFPYVMLKCSPAKILQGHNVFGFEDPKLGFLEMIGTLLTNYPFLFNDLDILNSELMQIDCTYFARFETNELAEQVIKALANVSTGQIKSRSSFETSVYWNTVGGSSGRSGGSHITRVAYLKQPEVLNEIKELEKIRNKNSFDALDVKTMRRTLDRLKALYSVKDYCLGMVRFEARIKARKLRDLAIPTNMIKFIKYCSVRKESTIQDLWHLAFDPIFKTFEGLTLMKTDDKSILKSIESKLVTVNDKGRVNRRRADAARGFYFELKSLGFDHVKTTMPKQTFYDRFNSLVECGLSRAFILSIENNSQNVVPLIREITINFGAQTPDNYQLPELKMASGLDVSLITNMNNKAERPLLRII
jgi:II/X family phage/plasmid replication protein